MIGNLKLTGLVLLALCAIGAIGASGASAQGVLTSDGEFVLDGTDAGAGAFTYPNLTGIECPESGYPAEAVGGGGIKSNSPQFTVKPLYDNEKCHAGKMKATVTSNECHYVIHIWGTLAEDVYETTADLACPTGKDFEMYVYFAENNENLLVCKITVKPQEGFVGAWIESNTAKEDLLMEGTFEGIKASKSGACGTGETVVAKRDLKITFKGTKLGQEIETGVKITD